MGIIFRKKLFESRVLERTLEIIPGLTVWCALIFPVVASFFIPQFVAFFIIFFDLAWTIRWYTLTAYLLRGYREIRVALRVDWLERLKKISEPVKLRDELSAQYSQLKNQHKVWSRVRFIALFTKQGKSWRDQTFGLEKALAEVEYVLRHKETVKDWTKIYHLVILATFKEGLEILEPSTLGVANNNFPLDRTVFVLGGEERDKDNATKNGQILKDKYGSKFASFIVSLHPDNPDEGRVKGSGISYAAKRAKEEFFDPKGINYSDVIVTVLDSDTVAHSEYLSHLTYKYILNPNRKYRSFQPIPFFYNNIWDAPAPMRLISNSSSFWQIIESMRPHRLRNFSSHAQSLEALVEVDYWDRFSINDDSRQFWRTYFAFEGHHKVVPLFIPVYNDAVLSPTYMETFRNQYLQLRRWAYGVSEFPYVVRHFLLTKKIKPMEKIGKTLRLFEGHFSWATAPLFMAVVAWLPLFLNKSYQDQILAHKLPTITSWILTFGMAGLIVTITLSLLLLPTRPKKYGWRRQLGMIFQWVLLPPTSIFFSSIPAIDAQTRLMLGKYMGFRVTEKARKSDVGVDKLTERIS